MAKFSVSIPQEMMSAAAIILAGDDYDPNKTWQGASAVVQACMADFLLHHKALQNENVQKWLTDNVGRTFETMLHEAVEP